MERSFRRELGLWDLVMVNMGAIVGSGWLFAALAAANLAGPASIVAWLVGALATLAIAPFFMELGTLFPESGSLARYTQYTQTGIVSFLVGWATYLGWVAFPPLETMAMIQYASPWFPGLFRAGSLTGEGFLAGIGLLAFFLLLNLVTVRLLARLNNGAVVWKLVLPLLTILVLLLAAHHAGNLTHFGGFAPLGSSGVFAAVSSGGVILTYTGFRHAIDMAGEARHPETDIPHAVWISIAFSTVLYVALEVAFILAVPTARLAAQGGWHALTLAAPFATLAGLLGLGWLVVLLHIDAVLSPADTALINLTSAGRTAHALSRSRHFPARLAHLNPAGEPIGALFLTFLVGVLFLLPFPSWRAMAGVVSDVLVLTYVTGPVAVGILRRDVPYLRRPFQVPWLRILAPVGFAVGSLLVYWSGWPTVGEVVLAEFAGLIIYAASYLRRGRPREELRHSLWLPAYLVTLTALSYVGSFRTGTVPAGLIAGTVLLHAPWDSAVVALVSVAFYAWGVRSGRITQAFREVRPYLVGLQKGTVTQGETGFNQPIGRTGTGARPLRRARMPLGKAVPASEDPTSSPLSGNLRIHRPPRRLGLTREPHRH